MSARIYQAFAGFASFTAFGQTLPLATEILSLRTGFNMISRVTKPITVKLTQLQLPCKGGATVLSVGAEGLGLEVWHRKKTTQCHVLQETKTNLPKKCGRQLSFLHQDELDERSAFYFQSICVATLWTGDRRLHYDNPVMKAFLRQMLLAMFCPKTCCVVVKPELPM